METTLLNHQSWLIMKALASLTMWPIVSILFAKTIFKTSQHAGNYIDSGFSSLFALIAVYISYYIPSNTFFVSAIIVMMLICVTFITSKLSKIL